MKWDDTAFKKIDAYTKTKSYPGKEFVQYSLYWSIVRRLGFNIGSRVDNVHMKVGR